VAFGLLSRIRKRSPDDPPPTEAWPIHSFGKLPVYKDFVSAGLTEDGAREMRDWLSNGFSRLWSEREECKGAEIPLHGFLLHLPGSSRFVAGALWGSHDQGGLRKFPFLLFSVVPAGRGASNLLTALDYLPVFEKRAREIRRKYSSSGSLADVYAELRSARIELPMRPEDEV
jgi:type VI secretion system ImpM family protein